MIHTYTNGNYTVEIDDVTGTKVRYTEDDEFVSAYPESIDCCITYKCDGGCKFCYAGCSDFGRHADLDSDYVNNIFIPSLKPYTELALNGNDLSHPHLENFLRKLKKHNIITNLTVNQKHFMKNPELFSWLCSEKLIYGLGVSLVDANLEFIKIIQKFPTAVIHTIAGLLDQKSLEILSNNNLKLLILGYKRKSRGNQYYVNNAELIDSNMSYLRSHLYELLSLGHFDVISFDNLALQQLNLKLIMSQSQWESFYMGDDGKFTFYVDLVNNTYARDSLINQNYLIENKSVDEMFTHIKSINFS